MVSNCSTYFGYSEDLAEYFLQMFSAETAVKFFEANEQQRPLTLRTNTLKAGRDAFLIFSFCLVKARRSSLMQALTARKALQLRHQTRLSRFRWIPLAAGQRSA